MKIYQLTLPPSSNTAYPTNQRGGGRHLSKAGREWKRANAALFLPAPSPPIQKYFVHIRLWFPDARRRDVGNYPKLIVDTLCEVWGIDDNWQVIPRLTVEAMGIDRERPRAELEIVPIP
jgi:crossover junction endodeoxyribonuclease RusA